jgi:hypothetical protein
MNIEIVHSILGVGREILFIDAAHFRLGETLGEHKMQHNGHCCHECERQQNDGLCNILTHDATARGSHAAHYSNVAAAVVHACPECAQHAQEYAGKSETAKNKFRAQCARCYFACGTVILILVYTKEFNLFYEFATLILFQLVIELLSEEFPVCPLFQFHNNLVEQVRIEPIFFYIFKIYY